MKLPAATIWACIALLVFLGIAIYAVYSLAFPTREPEYSSVATADHRMLWNNIDPSRPMIAVDKLGQLKCEDCADATAKAIPRFTVEMRVNVCDRKYCLDDSLSYILIDHELGHEYPFQIGADEGREGRVLFSIPSETTYTCIQNGDYAYVQSIK